MNDPIQLTNTIPSVRNSLGRPPWRRGFLLLALTLALASLALPPAARGVTPAPDGGYFGRNTAEGEDAFFSFGGQAVPGIDNTALGFHALHENVSGNFNTATGSNALFDNIGNNNTATGASALSQNTTGSNNTASGINALQNNTTGDENMPTALLR